MVSLLMARFSSVIEMPATVMKLVGRMPGMKPMSVGFAIGSMVPEGSLASGMISVALVPTGYAYILG